MNGQIRFAVNTHGKDKEWSFAKLNYRYRDTVGTLDDVKKHVKAGHALCAGLLGGKNRARANIIGSQWVMMDIDNSKPLLDENGKKVLGENKREIPVYDPRLTLEEALALPFVQKYCALIYTSASHRVAAPDWDKFRLVFLLPQFESDVDVLEAQIQLVAEEFPDSHDPNVKDASRVWYGSTPAEFPLFNPDVTLPNDWREKALTLAVEKQRLDTEIEKKAETKRVERQSRLDRGEINLEDEDALIETALSFIPRRSKGTGTYKDYYKVLCALHTHYGESRAETIAERWSPSSKKDDWDVGKTLARITHNYGTTRVRIGSLFRFAKQHGFKFPARVPREWQEAEPTLSGEEWQWKHGLPKWFREQVSKVPKLFKGFGKQPQSIKTSTPHVQKYVPGELPTPAEYKALGSPVIQFAKGERLRILREAQHKGHHDVLDSSATGTGKSHDVGLALPESFNVHRLWCFSPSHRNPTTAPVEANYADMPVRNNGLVVDETRRTAQNNAYVRWPQADEKPTTEGNCFRAGLFQTLAAKGYQDEAGLTSGKNPVCRTCHLRVACTGKDGEDKVPGAGFRRDRRDAFLKDRIRASLDSAPSAKELEAKEDDETKGVVVGSLNAAFLDEAMKQIKPVAAVEAGLSDFDQMFGEIETKLPSVHESLKSLRLALRPILAGEIKPTKETYHGWNDAAIRDLLSGLETEKIPEIIEQLKSIQPNFEEILTEPDGFTKDGVAAQDQKSVSNGTRKFIRSHLRQESYRASADRLRSLSSNWLIPFLEVLSGEKRGALRINNGTLAVITANSRHAATLEAMDFVVYLDATANREYLGLSLGIEAGEILHVEQEPARVENLSIVQITDFGLLGHERSKSVKERLGALKPALRLLNPDISFIEHKLHAEEGDGWWFNHNRGSNEFMTRSAIASFGVPYENIGTLQDLWLTLTGDRNLGTDAPAFSSFVRWQAQSEVAQAVGRLRANKRPDEKLTYISCGDFDLSFLERYYPGATITQRPALDITPAAGTAGQQTRWTLMQGIRVCIETGQKLTLTALAKHAHVTLGRASQIVGECGGWETFKKCLVVLLESLYRETKHFSSLPEELQFIVTGYLPEVAEDPAETVPFSLANTAKAYGWEAFEAILAATAPETRGKLLGALLSLLPATLLDELSAIATPPTPATGGQS